MDQRAFMIYKEKCVYLHKLIHTVNPQKRPTGLIFSLRFQLWVLLEFGYFCLLFFKFTAGLIRIRVLFEGGSLSRIYGIFFWPSNG